MSYEDRPLIQALQNFRQKQPVSFHVPGHKNGELSGLPSAIRQALAYDLTELTGLDDLHEPAEAIQQAERKLSRLYSSDRSFFLVNGSTVGNLAMLYATVHTGDLVLVQRNAHKSIFHALELTGAHAVFLSPDWHERTNTAGTVSLQHVQEALIHYPDIKAVVLTTPTYYGIANKELKAIIELSHNHDIPVLVDEAHGAHFIVHEAFPKSALELGADVVVQSAHKTLPAMTMASFLHIRSQLVDAERMAHFLGMLQSSSPSYLLMASLDDARYYAETYNEKDYAGFHVYRQQLIEDLRSIEGLDVVETDDQLKLLLRVGHHTGFALQEELENQGIYPELADVYQVLLVLPLVKSGYNEQATDLLNRCRRAVENVARKKTTAVQIPHFSLANPISAVVYPVTQLHKMRTQWISVHQATGSVVAGLVIPYPPGIPLLFAGERVTTAHIQQIEELIGAGCRFQGALIIETKQIKVVVE